MKYILNSSKRITFNHIKYIFMEGLIYVLKIIPVKLFFIQIRNCYCFLRLQGWQKVDLNERIGQENNLKWIRLVAIYQNIPVCIILSVTQFLVNGLVAQGFLLSLAKESGQEVPGVGKAWKKSQLFFLKDLSFLGGRTVQKMILVGE